LVLCYFTAKEDCNGHVLKQKLHWREFTCIVQPTVEPYRLFKRLHNVHRRKSASEHMSVPYWIEIVKLNSRRNDH
jgi:hypothetical protein